MVADAVKKGSMFELSDYMNRSSSGGMRAVVVTRLMN